MCASLPPSSLIVQFKEYNEEEAPAEDANTRLSPCDLSVVLFVTLFACTDTDRARLTNTTRVDRNNRRCVQENIFDTVVAGTATEAVSPEIDVRRMA